MVSQSQHSLLNHSGLYVIILEYDIFLQHLHCIYSVISIHASQHHLYTCVHTDSSTLCLMEAKINAYWTADILPPGQCALCLSHKDTKHPLSAPSHQSSNDHDWHLKLKHICNSQTHRICRNQSETKSIMFYNTTRGSYCMNGISKYTVYNRLQIYISSCHFLFSETELTSWLLSCVLALYSRS